MRGDRNYLFREGDLRETLDRQCKRAGQKVEQLPEEQVLNGSETDIIDALIEEFDVVPLQLKTDEIYARDPQETRIDVSNDYRYLADPGTTVPGVIVTIIVPFLGDANLFKLRPPTFSLNPPVGTIRGQELVITLKGVNLTSDQIETEYKATLQQVQQCIDWGKPTLEHYRQQLKTDLVNAFRQRRERLLAHRGLVAGLKLPLKRKEGPLTYPVPMVKRKPQIVTTAAKAAPFTPEPVLSDDDYEFIIDTMQKMSLVMEKSPHVFASLGEEDIRTHFLLPLNAAFEATAETFNFVGKTDILIRQNGKNVFIAECALWKGDEYLTQKIDQLLGYASWRDTKTAILLFSRNKDFSGVLAKIPTVVAAHPNCKKSLGQRGETQFRFLFHHREDRNRELTVTVMAFNVPKLGD